MAKYGAFKYGAETYGEYTPTTDLAWTFQVAWDSSFSGVPGTFNNEAIRLVDLSVRRGRRNLLGRSGLEPFTIGTARATLDNADGRYDPWNTSSPLYPYVKPGKFVRIAVKDLDTGTNYGIMRGIVDDIVLLKRGQRDLAVISVVDGLAWLQNQTVNIGLHQSIDKDSIIYQILDHSGWPMLTEWPRDITEDATELTYWWAWNQNALDALHEFNQAEGATAFHNRDGEFSWRPRDYAHERSISLDQTEILADIARPNPWENVRNVVRVTSQPKVLNDCNEILWQLQTVPGIAIGATFNIEPVFKYAEWQPCGAAIAFDWSVNAQADGGGADLSGDCTFTYETDIGEGAILSITNNSASYGYITLMKATGDAIYPPSIDIHETADTDSQADYGPRTLEIKSRWVETIDHAKVMADWLLAELKDPTDAPIIQLEDRPTEQFTPDLHDRVVLDIDHLGIRNAFRVGQIEHNWMSENGNAVRTVFRLEPYIQIGGAYVAYRGCRVYLSAAAQEIANNTYTAVEFDGENHDIGGYHSTTVNPDRITIPVAWDGYYRVYAQVKWGVDNTGGRGVYLRLNGNATAITESFADPTSATYNLHQTFVTTRYLEAGDYLQLVVYQNSGGALDVEATSRVTYFGVDYLGA